MRAATPETIRVLLLEDDPDDARVVGLKLKRLKTAIFAVTVVSRLADALASLDGADVVLADLSVPDSAGLATLQALVEAAPKLPVVVLTGNDDEALALEALKHGAQDYLVKGHGDGSELARVIRYAIERKAGEQALMEARDKAEQAARAKSVFLAMVGHEIRTPLNGILGMTRMLLETELDRRQQTFAETVVSSGELLLGLVNDILDFSRLDADGLTLQPTAFDVVATVEEVRMVLAARAAEKALAMSVSVAPGVERMVLGDRLRLRQILFNLAGNAIKFTDVGSVELAVAPLPPSPGGQCLRFTVTDTGIGIPEEARANLFTEFWQGEGSPSRRYGGAGLGLAICRRLVTLMGGEIALDSEAGRGSRFHVDLPLPATTQAAAAEQVPAVTAEPLNILLVDDNQVNREVAAGLLEARGHCVIVAAGGAAAIDMAAGGDFDLVLLDMSMPGMDGLSAARAIRQATGDAGPLLCLLTANPEGVPERVWREAGMDGCLGKPFRAEDVNRLLAGLRPGFAAAPGAPVLLAGEGLAEDVAALGADRMRSLVELFRATSTADLAAAEGHAAAGRLEMLAVSVHKLSSAAMSLHLAALASSCRRLEDQARAGDAGAVEGCQELRALWQKSLAAIEDALGS